jgi:ketosteroid isomerase-like protein
MKLKFALSVVLFLSLSNLHAQKNDNKGVDAVYHSLRKSFLNLDSGLFKSLYRSDAQFLAFAGPIGNGTVEFMKGINGYFEEVKMKKDSIDILFQIEKRVISEDGNMCTDVGYFLTTRKGSKTEKSVGKMTNIFTRQNGEWKFLVDMSSDAPLEVFKGKETLLINYR